MQARAHRFRLRSMALDRLKKRAPAVKTAVEAGVLIADRVSDVEDSLREMVGGPCASVPSRSWPFDGLARTSPPAPTLAVLLLAGRIDSAGSPCISEAPDVMIFFLQVPLAV